MVRFKAMEGMPIWRALARQEVQTGQTGPARAGAQHLSTELPVTPFLGAG